MLTILLVLLLISLCGGGFATRAAGGILSVFLYFLAVATAVTLAFRLFA